MLLILVALKTQYNTDKSGLEKKMILTKNI